jgi:retron-type reverse transcriptase
MAWVGKTERLWREKHNSFRPMGKMQQLLLGKHKSYIGKKNYSFSWKLIASYPHINQRENINKSGKWFVPKCARGRIVLPSVIVPILCPVQINIVIHTAFSSPCTELCISLCVS